MERERKKEEKERERERNNRCVEAWKQPINFLIQTFFRRSRRNIDRAFAPPIKQKEREEKRKRGVCRFGETCRFADAREKNVANNPRVTQSGWSELRWSKNKNYHSAASSPKAGRHPGESLWNSPSVSLFKKQNCLAFSLGALARRSRREHLSRAD